MVVIGRGAVSHERGTPVVGKELCGIDALPPVCVRSWGLGGRVCLRGQGSGFRVQESGFTV